MFNLIGDVYQGYQSPFNSLSGYTLDDNFDFGRWSFAKYCCKGYTTTTMGIGRRVSLLFNYTKREVCEIGFIVHIMRKQCRPEESINVNPL